LTDGRVVARVLVHRESAAFTSYPFVGLKAQIALLRRKNSRFIRVVPLRQGCRLPLIIEFLPLPVGSVNGDDLSVGSMGVTSATASFSAAH